MASLATASATAVFNLFTATAGDDFALDAVARGLSDVPSLSLASVLLGNASPEIYEQSLAIKYPTVNVYCENLNNTLKEKFRVFSGTAGVAVQIRHSQDQIQGIQASLETYATAACEILDDSRGDLGNGLFYRGGYKVAFTPVKRGGRNFLQVAQITLELDISA